MNKKVVNISGFMVFAVFFCLPSTAFSLSFTLGGSGSGQLFIAGNYVAEGFIIQDVSAANRARIEFLEGSINKLVLTGANIIALQNNISPVIEFDHMFQNVNGGGARHSLIDYSGGVNLRFPNTTSRTFTGTGFHDLCASNNVASCGVINQFANLTATINAPLPFGVFAPLPSTENINPGGGAGTFTYLQGRISIGPLNFGERAAVQTLSILEGFPTPPIDGDCAIGVDEADVTGDGVLDIVCAPRQVADDGSGGLPRVGGFDNTFDGFCAGDIDNCQTPAIPEPSTVLLMGTGLIGLLGGRYLKHARDLRQGTKDPKV